MCPKQLSSVVPPPAVFLGPWLCEHPIRGARGHPTAGRTHMARGPLRGPGTSPGHWAPC